MKASDPVQRRLEPGLGPAGQQGVLDLVEGLGQRGGLSGVVTHRRSESRDVAQPTSRFTMSTTGPVAERLVDVVGDRVGLVGEEAAPHALLDVLRGDLGDGAAGVAAAAVLRAACRPDRSGHAVGRQARAGQVHDLPVVVLPEPDDAVVDARQHVVQREGPPSPCGSLAAGLLGGRPARSRRNQARQRSASSRDGDAAAVPAAPAARPARRARRAAGARARRPLPR